MQMTTHQTVNMAADVHHCLRYQDEVNAFMAVRIQLLYVVWNL